MLRAKDEIRALALAKVSCANEQALRAFLRLLQQELDQIVDLVERGDTQRAALEIKRTLETIRLELQPNTSGASGIQRAVRE